MSSSTSICGCVTVMLLVGLAGCTVHPPGELEERATAVQVGKPFENRIEVRQMTPFPANPTSDQLVDAVLGNAELEQHYWEWRSAIEQIPQDATQTTTLNVAAGTSITNGHTSWGSSTLTLSNDPMTDIKWPDKLDAAAKQALENARSTGRRFFKAKYDLRYKVLKAYYDYALNAELIRLEQSNQRLLRTIATVAEARNRAGSGSGQRDVLKSSNEADLSGNDIANMRSQLPSQRAAINALLSRPADAPLAVPTKLPASRRVVYGDRDLVEMAAKQNPELIALADEIRGRGEGIRLAELQYVPDFNLSAGSDLMGVTQSLLAQATIPILRYEALNAAIAQAEAKLRATEAMRRELGNNLTAQVIADITIIRDAGRQLDLFDHTILPRARQVVNVAQSAFETGNASETDAASLLNLLDDQRSLIAIERLVAKLRITQATHLAELESITTSDLTRLHHTDTRPAAQ